MVLAVECEKEKLVKSQCQMETLHDQHADPKQFHAGYQVLVLQPTVTSPFEAKVSRPYSIVQHVSNLNYMIATPNSR